MNRLMSLLLVEDSLPDCTMFQKAIDSRTDINLVGMTNSSFKAIELTKTHCPEAIVLDIELAVLDTFELETTSKFCHLIQLYRMSSLQLCRPHAPDQKQGPNIRVCGFLVKTER